MAEMTSRRRVLGGLGALALAGAAGCGRGDAAKKTVADDPNRPLVLATTAWNPPYSHRDAKTGEIVGIDIDIARAAAAKLGRKLEVRAMPFEGMLMKVKTGEVDFAAASITITPGRLRDVDFSRSYSCDGSAFLYRVGETVPSMVRAERQKLGTVSSTMSDLYLCYHSLDPVRFDIYEDAVNALERKWIDALFYDAAPLRKTAKQSGGRLAVSELETRENYGIAIRKDLPALLKAVDEVIAERSAK